MSEDCEEDVIFKESLLHQYLVNCNVEMANFETASREVGRKPHSSQKFFSITNIAVTYLGQLKDRIIQALFVENPFNQASDTMFVTRICQSPLLDSDHQTLLLRLAAINKKLRSKSNGTLRSALPGEESVWATALGSVLREPYTWYLGCLFGKVLWQYYFEQHRLQTLMQTSYLLSRDAKRALALIKGQELITLGYASDIIGAEAWRLEHAARGVPRSLPALRQTLSFTLQAMSAKMTSAIQTLKSSNCFTGDLLQTFGLDQQQPSEQHDNLSLAGLKFQLNAVLAAQSQLLVLLALCKLPFAASNKRGGQKVRCVLGSTLQVLQPLQHELHLNLRIATVGQPLSEEHVLTDAAIRVEKRDVRICQVQAALHCAALHTQAVALRISEAERLTLDESREDELLKLLAECQTEASASMASINEANIRAIKRQKVVIDAPVKNADKVSAVEATNIEVVGHTNLDIPDEWEQVFEALTCAVSAGELENEQLQEIEADLGPITVDGFREELKSVLDVLKGRRDMKAGLMAENMDMKAGLMAENMDMKAGLMAENMDVKAGLMAENMNMKAGLMAENMDVVKKEPVMATQDTFSSLQSKTMEPRDLAQEIASRAIKMSNKEEIFILDESDESDN